MPSIIITTPKSTAANCYVTLDEASAYFDDRLYSDEWTAATVDDKTRALLHATKLLDELMEWNGYKRTLKQALSWPRSGVREESGLWLDYDTIPQRLKNGTCEMALALLKQDRVTESTLTNMGIEGARVGPISVTVDKTASPRIIPDHVIQLLAVLGQPRSGVGRGVKTVRLERT